MPLIYLATGHSLAVIRGDGKAWQATAHLAGAPTACVAVDPLRPELAYAGTLGQGLWRTQDEGHAWAPAGEGLPEHVTALAVSAWDRRDDRGVVWAGTEPSRLFRSLDGGQTWQERDRLQHLPSRPTWSFPPRPWTHHVRCLALDATERGRMWVGIELGGVMRSLDRGQTWEDRKQGGQHDAHTLRTHPLAPDRVYEAAGGGYAQSEDAGVTWQTQVSGLRHTYVWGVAVDPGDPDVVIVSAAAGPREAHDSARAESHVYRRVAQGPWQPAEAGLPPPGGRRAAVLAANPHEPGVFYAALHTGQLFRSADAGQTWHVLPIAWPPGYDPSAALGAGWLALEVIGV